MMLLAEPLRQLDLLGKISAHQHRSTVIKEQQTVLYRPSPGLKKPVSDERIAPKRMNWTADSRFLTGDVARRIVGICQSSGWQNWRKIEGVSGVDVGVFGSPPGRRQLCAALGTCIFYFWSSHCYNDNGLINFEFQV